MSIYRKFLRFWLTAASLLGFLFGWMFISQTTESETTTISNQGQVPSVSMPAIPSVDDLAASDTDTSGIQTFTFNQNQSGSMPQMRTGGS